MANDIIDGLLSEDVRQTPPTFADQQAAKLDSQKAKDRQKLNRLRIQKNERIAEIRKQGQERTREALRKVRADRDAKIKDLKARYRAKDAKARESRRATELREKIRKHVKKLSAKLLSPTDKKHIPQALREPVAKLLEAINLESNYAVDANTRKRVYQRNAVSGEITNAAGKYESPIYETKETHKEVEPENFAERKKRMRAATEEYGLTEREASGLSNYVTGAFCYALNGMARRGTLS